MYGGPHGHLHFGRAARCCSLLVLVLVLLLLLLLLLLPPKNGLQPSFGGPRRRHADVVMLACSTRGGMSSSGLQLTPGSNVGSADWPL